MSDTANITLPSSTYRTPSGLAYIKLPQGIIEILEVLTCLGALLGIAIQPDKAEDESSYWHLQAACGGFLGVTAILILLYVLDVPQKTTRFPWSMVQVFYCAGAAVALMSLAGHVAANTFGQAGIIVAVILSFIAMILYFIEIFFAIRAWKRSIIAETLRLVEEGKLGVSAPPSAMKENNAI
ncbi:uncharacterized protein LOC129271006 [Lytechinus pictus]|uniref:uncharacterized protein LOC129271006 n=1 Tax=Lytechinus pictus TaxID=7653 RepID=UPI0030B9BEF4